MLKNGNIKEDDSVIDLGCGNGMLLVELAREGFKHLLGVDYSEGAVKLASQIAADQELSDVIKYQQVDLLSAEDVGKLGKFKIVHDKGS